METPAEYLARTKSAAQHLFEDIATYLQILRNGRPPVLVGSYPTAADRDAALQQWMKEKAQEIEKGLAAERAFLAEKYALATLCGAILQIAFMAIRLYSKQDQVPEDLSSALKAPHALYCIGRRIRTVPLGLIVYAGRNQYNHIDDDQLREPNLTIFESLATKHGYGPGIRDPAFDLNARLAWNYPSNITSLLGWRHYASYEDDMRSLFRI
jgi:hypothetical protein